MGSGARLHGACLRAAVALVAGALVLGGCSRPQKAEINNETKFSQADYGVKASPRVTEEVKVAKGGGRYIVGKPYRVRGKWYKPKENPQYAATGMASWYGPNFHGRLTANGEIYDQYSLSAAHPTLPLPSYVRVTNMENGRSVMVRVNDRGPFAHGRIIDLSARAAKLLDYARAGVAKVRVEYAGPARMDGRDGAFLLASYRGPDVPGIAPGASQPGTLIATNESQAPVGSAAATGEFSAGEVSAAVGEEAFTPPGIEAIYSGSIAAALVPIPMQRPTTFDGIALDVAQAVAQAEPVERAPARLQPLSFAAEAQSRIAAAFAVFERAESGSAYTVATAADRLQQAERAGETVFLSLGTFREAANAEFVRMANSDLGLISVRRSWAQRGAAWEVRLLCAADAVPAVLEISRGRGLSPEVVTK